MCKNERLRQRYGRSMCYSAQITVSYRKFIKVHGGTMTSVHEFVDLVWMRLEDKSIKIPRSIEALFDDPQTEQERQGGAHVDAFRREQEGQWQQELSPGPGAWPMCRAQARRQAD